MPTLRTLNDWPRELFELEVLQCCSSKRWASKLSAARPFATEAALFASASSIWNRLDASDWKEAFSGHPKIGDLENLKKKFSSTSNWTTQEQSGVHGASEEVIQGLAAGNELYEKKFGFIFLVCATGKSASEMLEILNRRILNTPEEELKIAVQEQAKITDLRLRKLLVQSDPTPKEK